MQTYFQTSTAVFNYFELVLTLLIRNGKRKKHSHLVVPWTFTLTKKQFEYGYNSSRTLIPCHKCHNDHNDLGSHFCENKAGEGQNKRKLSDGGLVLHHVVHRR